MMLVNMPIVFTISLIAAATGALLILKAKKNREIGTFFPSLIGYIVTFLSLVTAFCAAYCAITFGHLEKRFFQDFDATQNTTKCFNKKNMMGNMMYQQSNPMTQDSQNIPTTEANKAQAEPVNQLNITAEKPTNDLPSETQNQPVDDLTIQNNHTETTTEQQ